MGLAHAIDALDAVASAVDEQGEGAVGEVGWADGHVAVEDGNVGVLGGVGVDGLGGVSGGGVDGGGVVGQGLGSVDDVDAAVRGDSGEGVAVGGEDDAVDALAAQGVVEGPFEHGPAREGEAVLEGQALGAASGEDDTEHAGLIGRRGVVGGACVDFRHGQAPGAAWRRVRGRIRAGRGATRS